MVYPGAGCAARRSASVYNLSSHASSSGARGDTTTIASPVVGLLWTSQWTTVRRYVTAYLLVRLLWRRARRDAGFAGGARNMLAQRSEEHKSELQSLRHLVCRLLLEK